MRDGRDRPTTARRRPRGARPARHAPRPPPRRTPRTTTSPTWPHPWRRTREHPMSPAELFSLPFMQRALLAALFTGLAAPAVGTYLVQRRLALMGDGIGHVAVTGVAIGLLTGWSPTWTAVVVAVLGAVAIELIRERGHTNGDVALALLFYGGLAGGVLRHRPRQPERRPAPAVPLRLDHHHLRRRRGRHDGAGRDRRRGLRRARAPAVRGRAGPRVRPGRRAAGAVLQPARRGARRGQRHRRDAHRRPAARLGADGRAGRDLAAAVPVVPHDARRGDGARRAGLGRRPGGRGVRVVPAPRSRPARRSCCSRCSASPSPGRSGPGCGTAPACGRRSPTSRSGHEVSDDHVDHDHGPECGHSAVPHDDHVDYVHDGHRHAPHGEHYDEH